MLGYSIYIYIAGSMSHLQTGMHQVDPPGLAKTYAMILRASAWCSPAQKKKRKTWPTWPIFDIFDTLATTIFNIFLAGEPR